MEITGVAVFVLLISLSASLQALDKNCENYDYKVDESDYPELLQKVKDTIKKPFEKSDVRYLRYRVTCDDDIVYCCNIFTIEDGKKTECTVAWFKSGRGISSGCASTSIY